MLTSWGVPAGKHAAWQPFQSKKWCSAPAAFCSVWHDATHELSAGVICWLYCAPKAAPASPPLEATLASCGSGASVSQRVKLTPGMARCARRAVLQQRAVARGRGWACNTCSSVAAGRAAVRWETAARRRDPARRGHRRGVATAACGAAAQSAHLVGVGHAEISRPSCFVARRRRAHARVLLPTERFFSRQ